MTFSPIEDLRLRLNRMAKRRGLYAPATQRLAHALDQLLLEWSKDAPSAVLAAQTLQAASSPDAATLKRRFETAKAKNDGATLAGLLPVLLQLDRADPDRPAMLNCAAAYAISLSDRPLAQLIEIALDEVIATATPYSRLQLSALLNVSAIQMKTGRFRTAYQLCRMLLRHRHIFAYDPLTHPRIYYNLSYAARWLGKRRLSYRILLQCTREPLFYEQGRNYLDTAIYSHQSAMFSLAEAKRALGTLYPNSQYKTHLLGSYAGTLLANNHPCAALALANHVLARLEREKPGDLATRMEVHLIMAAACHRLGRPQAAHQLLDRARELLGFAELYRPATVRMQDWLPLTADNAD